MSIADTNQSDFVDALADCFGVDFSAFGADEVLDSDELLDDELFDDESLDELESDELDELELSLVDPAGVVVEVLPRLSFLKNPLPLNVTPTGWNTFLTGIILPVCGCANSVSVSSWNDCCTSMVSPLSTNL